MKIQATITELTRRDLVLLLSTATTYTEWFVIKRGETNKDIDTSDDWIREDVWATILLAGRPVTFVDTQAEGISYGSLPFDCDEDPDGPVSYDVTLEDIKRGLAAAASGTFKHDYQDDLETASDAFAAYLNDSSDFDQPAAEVLMQIIVFNEIIY